MKRKGKGKGKKNEKQNKLLNNDNNANAKNKITSTNTKKDENKDILLKYVGDIDDKLFKEYSNSKNLNSFCSLFVRRSNEFDHLTNKEDKEKVVKKLKDIKNLVNHYIEMDENSEYRYKLIDIANAVDYFLYEYSKK